MEEKNNRDTDTGQFSSNLKPEEEAYILSNYQFMSDSEIAIQLNCEKQIIERFRKKKGLAKQNKPGAPPPPPSINKSEETTEEIKIDYKKERKDLQKYLKEDIKKLMPSEVGTTESRDKFIDKFLLLRPGFSEDEWRQFLSHWMRYMKEHQFDFNVAEDFDDLVGLIRELIIQQRIFQNNQNNRDAGFFQTMMKQYNDSVNRQSKFQGNLQLSRRHRKSTKEFDKESLADIINMFDDAETRKLMADADKEDNIELLGFMDRLKRKMNEEMGPDEDISGQESAMLLGMGEDKINEITNSGIDILEKQVTN